MGQLPGLDEWILGNGTCTSEAMMEVSMAYRLTRSISLFMVLTLLVPLCASANLAYPAQGVGLNLHGLENIGMDTWTKILAQGQATGKPVSEIIPAFNQILDSVKNEQQVFKQLKSILSQARIHSAEDYRDLGLALLEFRQEVRQRSLMSLKAQQDSLFLLQLMAEESLYIGSKKFSDFPKEITFQDKTVLGGSNTKLRQFPVQTGDVVLSKSTGFGSSSFIALTMDHPHIYSHSTPVFIGQRGELLSPEAEIEDGVKLRDMTKDYVENSKTRMYIYRYQGGEPGVQTKVNEGMQNLVAEMYQRTGGDPFNKAAYLYDFSMTPGEATTRGLFCSSVAYEAYLRAGLENSANPYTKKVWSQINKGREVLLKTLNMNTDRVPAPGDLELNRDFRLVGARVDIAKLHQDRIEMAIIDAFLTELEMNKESMARISSSLEAVAAKPLDKKGLAAMAKSGILPKTVADKIALVDKVPDSINLKQMAFFAFLNEIMTPKLRTLMLTQVSELESQGRFVGPVELRKMVRMHGAAMTSEIAAFEAKVSAVTGVGRCARVFN